MGNEYPDSQNIAIRTFLYQFSKKFKIFNNDDKKKPLEYFDYKCPYTGADLSNKKYVMDHIIPINQNDCGLHVYGNVLCVTRGSNTMKHYKSLEGFLKNDPKKLKKINKFMRESGFIDIHKKYKAQLEITCKSLYKKIRTVIETDFNDFLKTISNKK